MVTTSFDSCRTDCLLVTSNLRSATVAFTTELDTLIPYLLLSPRYDSLRIRRGTSVHALCSTRDYIRNILNCPSHKQNSSQEQSTKFKYHEI